MRRRLLLIALAATAACDGGRELLVSGPSVADDSPGDAGAWRPSAPELRKLVREALDDPAIRWTDDPKARRVHAAIVLGRSDVGGRGVWRAEIRFRLDGAGPDDRPVEVGGVVEKSYAAPTPLDAAFVRAHLARGLRDVGAEFLAQVRLLVADVAVLVRALRGRDPDLRQAAMHAAASRREKGAVEALIEILNGPDPVASSAAIGALVAIGDRRAVRPLCERTRLGDVHGMARILDAVAALGGDEARAYLELVGSGHDDPNIRAMAREALDRMQRLRR